MKRLLILALTMCMLIMPHNAISQQNYVAFEQIKQEASLRWTQTYETKWRTIEIDVQPSAPNVDEVPILKASADYWLPDISRLGHGWESAIRQDNGLVSIGYNQNGASSNSSYAKKKDITVINSEFFPPFDMEYIYPENSDLSFKNVIHCLEGLLESIGEKLENWEYKRPYRILCGVEVNAKGEFVTQGEYMLSINQKLHGIPLFNRHTSSEREISRRTDLFFNISSLEDMDLAWYKVKPMEIISNDIPLCTFSAVKSNIEKEIEIGHIRKIFDMDFGYALFNDPNVRRDKNNPQGTVYYAYPVWKINCHYVESGKKELRDYSKLDVPERSIHEFYSLLYDAQTGKMIDSISSPKGSGDYKGFVSWKDIGVEQ